MATSSRQRKDFLEDVVVQAIAEDLLNDAVQWVKVNLSVEEVFEKSEIIEHCAAMEPSDVFDEKTLRQWALDNGFVETED